MFEFSDKGKAEVFITKTGLTYGVRCLGYPNAIFAQFLFESDAKKFADIFNGTVALRVESSVTGGGGGFESRPVPHNAPAVVRQPLTDEQIDALLLPESGTGTIRDLVRIIEAAHGIGGNDD